MELLEHLILGILASALDHAQHEVIVHSGPPARYLALDPGGTCHQAIGFEGQVIRVPRAFRLVVQDLERVAMLPPCCEAKRWSTV